jgi:hypothetical protein
MDLAVTQTNDTIAILLGNGDGTFAAAGSVNSASGGSPSPIAVADFNGDGKLDIAVPAGDYTSTNESVSVLTGNGDGTFNSPFSSPGSTSTSVTWIQVADFNQDGSPDVVLADSTGTATVFLNNGSGLLLRGHTPHKKCNEYCAHSLFIHMAFSFREMRRYFIGEKSVGRMYIRSIFSTNLLASSDLIAS